jgi:hypothetical protein
MRVSEDRLDVSCVDCGRPYPHGLDVVLTKKQWREIHPDDGGVLCPSCIVNRAAKIDGAISVLAHIVTTDNIEPQDVPETMIHAMRLENADYSRSSAEMARELQAWRDSGAREALKLALEGWDRCSSSNRPRPAWVIEASIAIAKIEAIK